MEANTDENVQVQSDKDDSLTTQDDYLLNKQSQSDSLTTVILRWNFPTFGNIYLRILRNFITWNLPPSPPSTTIHHFGHHFYHLL